jgi:hypothetical protein
MNPTDDAPTTLFQSLDPDLPSIAALAAAEIDALIRRQQTSIENVGRLAVVLSQWFGQSGKPMEARRLLDPVSTTMFAKTIMDSHKTSFQSYNDLADITSNLAQQMNHIAEVESDSLLSTMKDFCLALSRYALASKGRIDNITPNPTFQR